MREVDLTAEELERYGCQIGPPASRRSRAYSLHSVVLLN